MAYGQQRRLLRRYTHLRTHPVNAKIFLNQSRLTRSNKLISVYCHQSVTERLETNKDITRFWGEQPNEPNQTVT
jgi:hypothetical protein